MMRKKIYLNKDKTEYTLDISDQELAERGLTRDDVTYSEWSIQDELKTQADIDEFVQMSLEEDGDDKNYIAQVMAQAAQAQARLDAQNKADRHVTPRKVFAQRIAQVWPDLHAYGLQITGIAPTAS